MLIFFILNAIHYDALGNVTNLTDSTGLATDSYTYTAFGNLIAQTGTTPNPHQFSTKPFNPATGLSHFGFRYYNPTTGRFLTPDPLGMIDGSNLYIYVNNNPANLLDPLGLLSIPWIPKKTEWKDVRGPFDIRWEGTTIFSDVGGPVGTTTWYKYGKFEQQRTVTPRRLRYERNPKTRKMRFYIEDQTPKVETRIVERIIERVRTPAVRWSSGGDIKKGDA